MNDDRRWVCVTECENIPLREGRSLKLGSLEIAIFNLGDRFLALDNSCPHKSGPLSEGIVSGSTVVCPLHAWKIDLYTGAVVGQASATTCVKTYSARVHDDFVYVELPVQSMPRLQESAACVASSEISTGRPSGVNA